MLNSLINRVFGTRHERDRQRIQPLVDVIREHATRLEQLSDEEITGQTAKFRATIAQRTGALEAKVAELKAAKRAAADLTERDRFDVELQGHDGRAGVEGELRDATDTVLDELLAEAYATVREACRRLTGTTVTVTGHDMEWNMVPYDVQLIGGIQLHRGRIAEMATGEGKTLVATLPLYLNALPGKGAHLVTVNSYLARRDSQWMGHVFRHLGLTVGCLDDTDPGTPDRRAAYACDITYGTNNEFGFDYLRDNMVVTLDQRVQRGHAFAIVDEVDSVLIDEARTPLIISGPVGNESDGQYAEHNAVVSRLVRRQTEFVNQLVGDGERALAEGRTADAALALYKAQLGGPKNKRLLKVMQETGAKGLVQKMELDHIADRKQQAARQNLRDIEEDLLYVLDEKGHTVHLTDQGVDFMSPADHDAFVLPDISGAVHRNDHDETLTPAEKPAARRVIEGDYAQKSEKLNIVHQLLRAHALYEREVNYVVLDGQVLIVDEFTGRTMPGRRWSEGLHQAVEAKEGVQVKGETQTLATITIQNYFRMYDKLAGMTGTAETEETEFFQIYKLEVAVVPTNQPVIRDDRHDLVYKTRREKYNAILEETQRLHGLGYPVLIGTVNVDVSETLSRMFKRAGMTPNVLNAKYHQREAEIVAAAGQPGTVTIATNMAGRGTDIKLGAGVTESKPSIVKDEENQDVEDVECGGLHILGSERHESRRIDRQLRGRAGRQGDPGASQFFLSLEDDLMRLFGSERIAKLMDRLGAQDGEVLTHPLITRSIETAQKRVELQNFQQRKRLLEYDDVMNQQREVVYSLRSFALDGGEEVKGEAAKMVEKAVVRRIDTAMADVDSGGDFDFRILGQELLQRYLLMVPAFEEGGEPPASAAEAVETGLTAVRAAFAAKFESLNATVVGADGQPVDVAGPVLSHVMLGVLDEKWKDHLYDLDQLRNSINYRAWGQKDPLVEYKGEAYTMFVDLMHDIYTTFTERFLRAQLVYGGPGTSGPGGGPPPGGPSRGDGGGPSGGAPGGTWSRGDGGPTNGSGSGGMRPAKRYNALGVLEDVPAGDVPSVVAAESAGGGRSAEPATRKPAAQPEPTLVGAGGRPRPLGTIGTAAAPAAQAATDWSTVGRNDPCPCGSGKKFKKCHGAGGL